MDVPTLLAAMEQDVSANANGDLTLGWRIRLWSLLNRTYPDTAHYRRCALAYVVAQDALRFWPGKRLPPQYQDVPHQLLALCRSFLLGQLPADQMTRRRKYLNDLHYLGAVMHLGLGVICGHAAWAACSCVNGGEDNHYEFQGDGEDADEEERGWFRSCWEDDHHLEITDLSLGDPWSYDTHAHCGVIACGGSLLTPTVDPEVRRRYWLRWLREFAPLVAGPSVAQIQNLVGDA